MAKPTVKGSPHFNTAGYYVHLRVKIEDDVDPPAAGDPQAEVMMVRVWGMSQASDKRCSDNRKSTQSKMDESWPALPWDSEPYWKDHWFPYESSDEYYRICAEVSLSDGTRSYKCAVWKIPSTQAGSITLDEVELKDC
jgi:hypothetical protein